MGEENIRVVHGNPQLRQPGQQCLTACLLPEARVHQQIPLPGDDVGIETFQRISGQRNGDGVEAGGE